MLSNFIAQQLRTAAYRQLEDGSFFGEIPSLPGVWADASQLEACRNELRDVLEDWIILTLQRGEIIHGLERTTHGQDEKAYA